MKYVWFFSGLFFLVLPKVQASDTKSLAIDLKTINAKALFLRGDKGQKFLVPKVGRAVVENLALANGKNSSTTSCRLENKRIVKESDLALALKDLSDKGYNLLAREVKDVPDNAQTGTFTFYGTSVKFQEAKHLPKTSIKLRLRIYIYDDGNGVKRSAQTAHDAHLEIKIKNPYPEYPLSVHKYRLLIADEDVLVLINADPKQQGAFHQIITDLAIKAHARDQNHKEAKLIDAMFEAIGIIAIAEIEFIKPKVAITYFRISKKYDETYGEKTKKKRQKHQKNNNDKKKRSYEMTIDESIQAFYPQFLDDEKTINIEKYFIETNTKTLLIGQFPKDCRIVEFKQPDSIGYDGPGCFRRPHTMSVPQRDLWQAFVATLGDKALQHTRPDAGKYSHVKEFLRIKNNQARDSDKSIMY